MGERGGERGREGKKGRRGEGERERGRGECERGRGECERGSDTNSSQVHSTFQRDEKEQRGSD